MECTLLAGNRYTSPEDFLQDIALTFSNAIKFNKDGRDIGDPGSCAYYDASVHLLRYARWLSLEQLHTYVEDSDHVDEPGPDGLPPLQWKLTTANLAKAREEQKKIVLDETIERSLEGDRWTWYVQAALEVSLTLYVFSFCLTSSPLLFILGTKQNVKNF